eukprot:Gb_33035 [translate_table: standard]
MALDKTSFQSKATILISILVLVILPVSQQLKSSQVQTLLRIQRILGFPNALKGLSNYTDFCNLTPSSSLTIVCYEDAITQLQIVGNKGSPSVKLKRSGTFSVSNQTLPSSFSMDSLVTTLSKLSSIKVLSLVSLGLWGSLPSKIERWFSLEILNVSSNFLYGAIPQELSSLRNLQTLILDNNMFNGTVPDWLSALPSLAFLSLRNNSLNGSLPTSLSIIQSLRVLYLSGNQLSGDLPDLSSLTNLQLLDLQGNRLGPVFPTLGKKLVTVVLSKNKFKCHIPSDLVSFYQLQQLDLSFNALIGSPPPSLFSLPVLRYLNLAGNSLSGVLPQNLTCSSRLEFVDLSSNLLTGNLPACLVSQKTQKRTVEFAHNCLNTKHQHQHQHQHPYSYCQNATRATGVNPRISKKASRTIKVAIVLGIVGGVVGLVAVLGLLVLVLLRRSEGKKATKNLSESSSTGLSSDLLANASYDAVMR